MSNLVMCLCLCHNCGICVVVCMFLFTSSGGSYRQSMRSSSRSLLGFVHLLDCLAVNADCTLLSQEQKRKVVKTMQ